MNGLQSFGPVQSLMMRRKCIFTSIFRSVSVDMLLHTCKQLANTEKQQPAYIVTTLQAIRQQLLLPVHVLPVSHLCYTRS